ncbi:putative Asp-hemolysin precursor [Hygrophoropsis aurantiaca]|uniref:Asp-hemolysin n=1 Tax=Hygrophoropsis aurantiaca TaxID=72124 RepID=A0ACB8A663_9AGAM|nr:putative Asp-hemolysin precursor [Hygrophoropsis aurantiaca]
MTICNLRSGRFYDGTWQNELSNDQVNAIVIDAGTLKTISACGSPDKNHGTEGTIDLYDNGTKVCTLYWDVPWHSSTNNFEVRNKNANYIVRAGDWHKFGGALGNVDIEVETR